MPKAIIGNNTTLKSISFSSPDMVTRFINDNGITKDNLVAIVPKDNEFVVFYWVIDI